MTDSVIYLHSGSGKHRVWFTYGLSFTVSDIEKMRESSIKVKRGCVRHIWRLTYHTGIAVCKVCSQHRHILSQPYEMVRLGKPLKVYRTTRDPPYSSTSYEHLYSDINGMTYVL